MTEPKTVSKTTTDKDPMAEAIRVELHTLTQAETPFGIAQLASIERIAGTGKQLLQAAQGHDPNKMRQRAGSFYQQGSSLSFPTDVDTLTPVLPNSSETFGTAAMRELSSMVKQMGQQRRSRREVLRELATARELGLDDIAAELKQELSDMKNIDARMKGDKPGIVSALAGSNGTP